MQTTAIIVPTAIAKLLALKGQFVAMRTIRSLKVKKGCAEILKDSTFTCRVGVNYDNIANVQEKRESGELPAENAGLPWGEWFLFPHIIAHKGNHYFRCTAVHNDNQIPKVIYTRNGVVITKEEAKADSYASEFGDREERDVFTVKIESILEVNGEALS
jgi:hypothetical protein